MGDGDNLARRLVRISTLTLTNAVFSHCTQRNKYLSYTASISHVTITLKPSEGYPSRLH